ncbi:MULTISPECIES: hypothetical protein [unclassified Francisella]|uniref:hypothetical protein n=1 Tax=unclassified Francisella TaxID=2610885 RepID=UPI002E2EFC66|nr:MULTISPECIES: hypothetical protein [unclassified Francisella]MED7820151.1 hypothetical protein [Francisella sp. 19S2-4]MED7830976.1 hypothetical protein [Francisella sp. 19S2-10]
MKKILFYILLILCFNLGFTKDIDGWDYVPSKIGSKYTYMLNAKSGKDNISYKLIVYIVNCQNSQKNCIEKVSFNRLNKNNILYASDKITSTDKGVKSIEDISNSNFKYSAGIYLPKKLDFDKPIKSESNIKTKKGNIKYQETDKYSKVKSIEINKNIYKNCIKQYASSSSSSGIKSLSKTIYCKNIGLVQASNTTYLKNGSKIKSTTELVKIDYPFSK